MKKLSISLLKGLLVIVLFTGTSIALHTAGVKTISEAKAAVTEQQVIDYLEEYGYQVLSACPKPNTAADWICHTRLNGVDYWTTVHVIGSNIIGHDNVPY